MLFLDSRIAGAGGTRVKKALPGTSIGGQLEKAGTGWKKPAMWLCQGFPRVFLGFSRVFLVEKKTISGSFWCVYFRRILIVY